MGLNCPPRAHSRVSKIFSHCLLHSHFSIVWESIRFNVWVIAVLDLTPEKHLIFWVHDAIGPNLGILGAITFVNKVDLGWNFDQR